MKSIPKICHFLWTKGSPMSVLQVLSVVSFHRYNPDWQIIVHLTKQKDGELGANRYVPDYTGQDKFDFIESLDYVNIQEVDLISEGIGTGKYNILVSDILRVRLLHQFGGVYSDFDMIWIRPMSEFKNIHCIGNPEDFETTACFYELTKGHHNNSNIISEPGGEYLASIIREQDKLKPPYDDYQAFNTSLFNRVYPDFESIQVRFPRVLAMDYKTLYPYSTFDMQRLFILEDMTPLDNQGVIGVHWFNGNRLSKAYVNNGHYTPCSMTTLLKTEGYI